MPKQAITQEGMKKALMAKNPRSANWCFTLNNPGEAEVEYIQDLVSTGDAKYLVFQHEIGENGTPHLQGTVVLKSIMAMSQVKGLIGARAHLEITHHIFESIEYCKKDRTRDPLFPDVFEAGVPPVDQRAKGEMEKNRWRVALTAVREGRWDDVDPQIQVQHFGNLQKIESRFQMGVKLENTFKKNLWFHGPTGSGKSRAARELYPEAYIKNTNKWWDGYRGQKTVIIEELQPGNATTELVGLMKIWLDHYPFNGEVKNSSMMLRPEVIIITSNYRVEEIFLRSQDSEPIHRRVDEWEFSKRAKPVFIPWKPAEPEGGSSRFFQKGKDQTLATLTAPILERQQACQPEVEGLLRLSQIPEKRVKFAESETQSMDEDESEEEGIDDGVMGQEDF